MIGYAIRLVESGRLPDIIIRLGIRNLLRKKIREQSAGTEDERKDRFRNMLRELSQGPVALVPEKANEQHYEIPPEFFKLVLGDNLKYSSGFFLDKTSSLSEAEDAMLEETCKRVELADGQDILELGCGWGSLTIRMAQIFPSSTVTAISNSNDQRIFIENRLKELKITNVKVITADMNDFSTNLQFDRIISVEMFEHMHNYKELLRRISSWLRPDGKLFVHIFSHREFLYPFVIKDETDWMSKYFFTGGIMPSRDIFNHFTDHVKLENQWQVNGMHYARTSRAWLEKMDVNRKEIMPIFEKTYGKDQAKLWFQRWRIFFMACEELFAYNKGNDWFVSHYLLQKQKQ